MTDVRWYRIYGDEWLIMGDLLEERGSQWANAVRTWGKHWVERKGRMPMGVIATRDRRMSRRILPVWDGFRESLFVWRQRDEMTLFMERLLEEEKQDPRRAKVLS